MKVMDSDRPDQEIVVRITRDFSGIEFSERRLRHLLRAACARYELPVATIGVAIVDDSAIRRLHRQFLHKNRSTDCLSFDLSDDRLGSESGGNGRGRKKIAGGRLFELVVNGEMAVRQARRRGHSPEAELALYTVHGLLHNLGFDDSTEGKARRMHRTEDEILQDEGYGLVYDTEGRYK
jgi:probable rRNA maturation factor